MAKDDANSVLCRFLPDRKTPKNPYTLFILLSFGMLGHGPALADNPLPMAALPLTTTEKPEKIALGERLFAEPRLSDKNARSCATCHPIDQGGMDNLIHSESADGIFLLRNTPTLFNVSFNYYFNWDGVVSSLEAHTEKVMLNPKIMNASWPELIDKLAKDQEYRLAFQTLYSDGLNKSNLIDAITSYEKSLVTPNSRFDRFLRGEQQMLNEDERQGYQLFQALGCIACHQGVNIGGNLFQKFGIFGEPEGSLNPADQGRYAITKNERDRGVFRVPSLRNVAITAPYFHDGRAANLEKAVELMAWRQLGKSLNQKQRDLIVRFLNTLTGEYQGKPVAGHIRHIE